VKDLRTSVARSDLQALLLDLLTQEAKAVGFTHTSSNSNLTICNRHRAQIEPPPHLAIETSSNSPPVPSNLSSPLREARSSPPQRTTWRRRTKTWKRRSWRSSRSWLARSISQPARTQQLTTQARDRTCMGEKFSTRSHHWLRVWASNPTVAK